MKAELITKKEFQPVTIQLTFEKQEEVNAMYAITNASSLLVWNAVLDCGADMGMNSDIWNEVAAKIFNIIENLKK